MKYVGEQSLLQLLTLIYQSFCNKVDVIEGKSLSTNDFTDEYKEKLDNSMTWGTF